jgi:hypothetical protein
MGTTSFMAECDDAEYEQWLTTFAEASARLDVLQTAITELCQLCARQDVHSEQVLEVLERHGAITKATPASAA